MGSGFTRRNFLNESMQAGLYCIPTTPEQAYTPSTHLSTRSSRTSDLQKERNYDRILQRIRGDERRLPSSRVNIEKRRDFLEVTDRSHSLSPGEAKSDGTIQDSVSDSNLSTTTAAPNLHSRHQQFLRRRLLENGLQPNTGTGTPLDAQQQQYMDTIRPTYSIGNVPLRSLEELRETIGIRRQYYRERLFGKPEEVCASASAGDEAESCGSEINEAADSRENSCAIEGLVSEDGVGTGTGTLQSHEEASH